MSSFSLHIATDNAAFTDDPGEELARILLELVENRTALVIDPNDHRYGANEGTVRDYNGNTVGRWTWTDSTDDGAALDRIAHIIEHRDDLEAGYSFLAAIAEAVRLTGRTIAPDDDESEDERDEYEPRGDYGPDEIDAQHIRDAGRGHLI